MSQSASPRRTTALVAVAVVVVAAVIGFALWQLGGDDDGAQPLAAGRSTTPAPTTPTPEPTTPTPTPVITTSCEGPDTQFNVEGIRQESLLPDCGVAPPVTQEQQLDSGLGLACGGSFPVILYKTTTSGAKTSICGKDSSGVDFRLVTQPKGGEIVDVKGDYDPQLDAFVGRKDGTSYLVQAYDGTLLVTKNGKTTKQPSSDFISLDNESDFD